MRNIHQHTYDLGEFASLACAWNTLPQGGRPGDYIHIGADLYAWDEQQHNWVREDHPHTDSYWLLQQSGDLHLMGDMRVGGRLTTHQHARFKGDVTVEGTLRCHRLEGHDKGLFTSADALREAVPMPRRGDWALVGSNETPQLWQCDADGTWTSVGTACLAGAFDLHAYDRVRDIVDDAVAHGYVFAGVADPTTNPHQPLDYNVCYLTSTNGTYVHFGNIEVRHLSMLLWAPGAFNLRRWTAKSLLREVFVSTDNIQDGAVTIEKTQGIKELIQQETMERTNATLALTGRVIADEKLMVKSVSVNSGQPKLPDEDGNVNLVIAQGGGGEYDEDLAAQVEQNAGDIITLFERIADIGGEEAAAVRSIMYWQAEEPETPQRAGLLWYNVSDQTLYSSVVIGTNPVSHQRVYGWGEAEVNAEAIYMDVVNNMLYRYDIDLNDLVAMPQQQEDPVTIDIDDALSTTSENPVQNKVITAKVGTIEQTIAQQATAVGSLSEQTSTIGATVGSLMGRALSLESAVTSLRNDVNTNTEDIGENATAIGILQDAQIAQFKKTLQPDGLHIFAEKADGGTTNDVVVPYASHSTPGILSVEDKAKIDSITPGQGEQDEETPASLQARIDSPLYPEHYLSQEQIEAGIKYCPEYHKWPLVWHSTPENYAFQDGTLITDEQLTQLHADIAAAIAEDRAYGGEVFAPSKWIYPAWELYATSHSTSVAQVWRNVPHANDVLWDENSQRFVLYYNNTVYTKWGNSHLWMGSDHKPVKDTLHVRMPKWLKLNWAVDIGYQWKPKTRPLTLIWDGEDFYDAFQGVTDFWQAIKQCIAATNKLRLAPGKLYYGMMASNYDSSGESTDRIPLAAYADIDGQDGGLFIRKDNAMPTGTSDIFYISNSSSAVEGVKIHDITIASIQDHYGWGISFHTQPRLSVADSGLRFLKAQFNVRGLIVENVKTFNMHSDFSMESTEGKENRRIVWRNVTSRNVSENILGKVSNCIFDNYDVTSDGHAGGGGHLIYLQGSNYGVTFRNCRFVQLERFRQPMFDFQGGKSTAAYADSSVEFHNCYIEGGKLFFCGVVNNNNYAKLRWLRFFNCTLFVRYRTYGRNYDIANDSQSDGKYTNWQFDHCNIACQEVFMRFGHRYYFNDKQLIVRDCNLVRYKGGVDVSSTYPAFFAGFNGKFISERNYVELPMDSDNASNWTPQRYINDEATPYVVEARSGAIILTTNIHRHAVPSGQETAVKVARAAMGIAGLCGPYSDLPSQADDGTLYYDLTYNRPLWAYNELTTDNNTSDTNPTSSRTLTWYDEDGQAAIDTTPNLPLPARPLFPLAGPLTDLPSEATDGTVYFDTTNHRPLWATHLSDGVGHTFLAWVDATGTPVAS